MQDLVMSLFQRHLDGPFKPSGDGNYLTRCPFHKGGMERKPSFSINPSKGLFHCFTCHLAGDAEQLLRLLGLPRSKIDSEIKDIKPVLEKNRELRQLEKEHIFDKNDPYMAKYILPEVIMGIFDWVPETLVQKGFDAGLLKEMEVGFDKNLQRITYPLRDVYGNLAGFSGGAINVNTWPKYLVYQGARRSDGSRWIRGDFGDWFDQQYPGYTCENHEFLWNLHRVLPRIAAGEEPLFIVEGFKACLWMIQNGYPNTVALMGSYISERQQQLLHRLGCPIVLFLDNDEAGRRATLQIGKLLYKPMYGKIRVAQYPEEDKDTQPDSYGKEQLDFIVKDALPYLKHRIETLKKSPQLVRRPSQNGNFTIPSKRSSEHY